MELVTRENEDDIDAGVVEHLFVVCAAVLRPKPLRVAEASSAAGRADATDLDTAHFLEDRQVHPPRQVAGADKPHTHGPVSMRTRSVHFDPLARLEGRSC